MTMRGFTLLETIIYIGVFSLIVSALFTSTVVLHDTSTYTLEKAEKIQSELYIQDLADIGRHYRK